MLVKQEDNWLSHWGHEETWALPVSQHCGDWARNYSLFIILVSWSNLLYGRLHYYFCINSLWCISPASVLVCVCDLGWFVVVWLFSLVLTLLSWWWFLWSVLICWWGGFFFFTDKLICVVCMLYIDSYCRQGDNKFSASWLYVSSCCGCVWCVMCCESVSLSAPTVY